MWAAISRIRSAFVIGDAPGVRERLGEQVLRTMIDERLELEEAKRRNVTASDTEVDKAMGSIAKQNNLTPAQLDAILKSHGIDRSALLGQLMTRSRDFH